MGEVETEQESQSGEREDENDVVRPKGWRVSGRNGEGEGKGWKENEKRKSIGIRTSGREKK